MSGEEFHAARLGLISEKILYRAALHLEQSINKKIKLEDAVQLYPREEDFDLTMGQVENFLDFLWELYKKHEAKQDAIEKKKALAERKNKRKNKK